MFPLPSIGPLETLLDLSFGLNCHLPPASVDIQLGFKRSANALAVQPSITPSRPILNKTDLPRSER